MGARGACNICYHERRAEIDAAKAGGVPVATIARTFGVATTTCVRHFKNGHARPAPAPVARPAAVAAPAPARYQSGPTRGSVPFSRVRAAAELLEVPLHALAMCISEHAACDITVTGDDDEEALYAEFDRADEDAAYVADVARHGTFLAGNGT